MTYNRFDCNYDEEINGYAAECLLDAAIRSSKKIHSYNFNSQVLADTIENDPAGLKYLKLAEPFLSSEFAVTSTDELGRKISILASIEHLPVITVVDYVLGLDYCVEFFGYRIGIDVTVDPNSVVKKQRKKSELANVYSKLRFDKIVILIVSDRFDSKILESKLKAIKNSAESEFNHVVNI